MNTTRTNARTTIFEKEYSSLKEKIRKVQSQARDRDNSDIAKKTLHTKPVIGRKSMQPK